MHGVQLSHIVVERKKISCQIGDHAADQPQDMSVLSGEHVVILKEQEQVMLA